MEMWENTRALHRVGLLWFCNGAGEDRVEGATTPYHVRRPRLPAQVRVLLGVALVALIALLPRPFNVFSRPRGASAAPLPAMVCNGHWQLCGRRFNEVVLPATHNSMAASEAGYARPSQQHTIRRQLDDGVRMLLIDSHHWETRADLARVEAKFSPEQKARFEESLREPAQPPGGIYLCHVFCGAGATPLGEAMAAVREFLANHPNDVMGLFLEDYVTGNETAAVFDAAGLTSYIYEHPYGTPWPLLRDMIAANKRLVVFSEHGGGAPSWYENGWMNVQDTRYDVTSASDFTCGLNRGTAADPLFLLNHWIAKGTPSAEDAALVNSYDFLLTRARRCEAERGLLPNFIAVNFYDRGDLFRVVDTLNGIPGSPG